MENLNPNGPYPGRQIFAGTTPAGKACFVYLVTGRSQGSRERKAKTIDDVVRIMPSDSNTPFDSLRHYIAVKYDNKLGLAVITNGIQTEAIFEAYRLSINLKGQKIAEAIKLLHDLLNHAGAEPDSIHTPRIAAAITAGIEPPQGVIGSIGEDHGYAYEIFGETGETKGTLSVVSTYVGNMNDPQPNMYSPETFECSAETPEEIAKYIFEISAAKNEAEEDIRVCSVAGVFSNGKWKTSIINAIC